ncbi:MAG: hypothetical protein KKF56_00295 [Nanoarchaeota archaeon]|nr:hypothetical protein [Nanoarchaeota archaeon]
MAISWVIIAILIFLIFVFFKFKDVKHRMFTIFLILVVLFFYASFVSVVDSDNINLGSADGIMQAGKIYFSWLGSALKNIVSITSNVVKMDWSSNVTAGG